MEQEFERKALLDRKTYERLLTFFGKTIPGRSYIQKNHYYDTTDLLLSRVGATLRVRENEKGLSLQYKHNQKQAGDIRCAIEDNRKIDAVPAKIGGDMLPGTDPALVFLPLGTLTTARTDFRIGNSVVSLDKSDYLGLTDYEIEVETPGALPLPAEVLSVGIDFSRPVTGKYHRFLAAWKKGRSDA